MKFLCLDFINSRWYTKHKPFCDPMENPDWLAQIAERYHLPEISSLSSNNELKVFRELLFQALLGLCNQQQLEPSFIERINAILEKGHTQEMLVLKENRYYLQTRHYSNDLVWVMYQIARSFSELISQYPLTYLKKCENPECDWIFYDDSKSHTRKWCDNRCANLMKVRRYRAKKI